jgi:hypothetical protein
MGFECFFGGGLTVFRRLSHAIDFSINILWDFAISNSTHVFILFFILCNKNRYLFSDYSVPSRNRLPVTDGFSDPTEK